MLQSLRFNPFGFRCNCCIKQKFSIVSNLQSIYESEVNSTNPVVKAIVAGTAPRPAQLAAARGILPLPQTDLLEILVALAGGADTELAENARNTLVSRDASELAAIVNQTKSRLSSRLFRRTRGAAETDTRSDFD
jgi:hypothetical protein